MLAPTTFILALNYHKYTTRYTVTHVHALTPCLLQKQQNCCATEHTVTMPTCSSHGTCCVGPTVLLVVLLYKQIQNFWSRIVVSHPEGLIWSCLTTWIILLTCTHIHRHIHIHMHAQDTSVYTHIYYKE